MLHCGMTGSTYVFYDLIFVFRVTRDPRLKNHSSPPFIPWLVTELENTSLSFDFDFDFFCFVACLLDSGELLGVRLAVLRLIALEVAFGECSGLSEYHWRIFSSIWSVGCHAVIFLALADLRPPSCPAVSVPIVS